MYITNEDVAEFQALYRDKFAIELDYQEAFKKLSLLVRQMELVYQPITKKQYDDYIERFNTTSPDQERT